MGFAKQWDETTPKGTDYHSSVDDHIIDLKVAIRERANVQHHAYSDESGHSDVWEHKPGECTVLYVGNKADFPTPTASRDGCIAYATDEKIWYRYDVGTSSWVEVDITGMSGIVFTSGDQTIGGTKTFSSIPVLPGSDPSSDNHAVRKAYVDAQVDGIATYSSDVVSAPSAGKVPKLNAGGYIFPFLKIYDTGWFSVVKGNAYSYTHNLGTTKIIYYIYFSTSSDGSNAIGLSNLHCMANAEEKGMTVKVVGSNSVKLITGQDYCGYTIGDDGVITQQTSGYARLIILGLS